MFFFGQDGSFFSSLGLLHALLHHRHIVYHNLEEKPPGGTRCRLGVSSSFLASALYPTPVTGFPNDTINNNNKKIENTISTDESQSWAPQFPPLNLPWPRVNVMLYFIIDCVCARVCEYCVCHPKYTNRGVEKEVE